jgi:SPP1 gp7 family putative phage head morphogenesis protein
MKKKSPRELMNEINKSLSKSIEKGFELARIKHEVPPVMLNALRENVFVFSGMKTYHELKQASGMLVDADGNVKPFYKFKQDVESINATYNEQYLEAEYSFAVHSSQMAAKWNDFEQEGDEYYIQYRTAGDDKVRPEHAALNNTTLPIDDPFWDSYTPPLDWGCRCDIVQVIKNKYPESDSQNARQLGETATTRIGANGKNKLEMFRFNPGKEMKIFPERHPYFARNNSPEEIKQAQKTVEEMTDRHKVAKDTLQYGKDEIIGKYAFEHEKFTATFTRNSFTENLRFGKIFEGKVEILKDIKNYLKNAGNYSYSENNRPEVKPNVNGYHKLTALYNGNIEELKGKKVEFQFEDRGKHGTIFHFIKFI